MNITANTTVAEIYQWIRQTCDIESKGCPCVWIETFEHLMLVAIDEFEFIGQRWKAIDLHRKLSA